MGLFDKVKGILESDEELSELAKTHRIQEGVYQAFREQIEMEQIRGFPDISRRFGAGNYFLPEDLDQKSEKLERIKHSGLLDSHKIAGETFYTVTERGEFVQETYDEIIEELDVMGRLADINVDIVDDISEIDTEIPPEYDLGVTKHDSGLKEKQDVTKNGKAEWRITKEGKEVKSALEDFTPIITARILAKDGKYEPNPGNLMNTLKKYSGDLEESEVSSEIVNVLGKSLEGGYQTTSVEILNTYVEMITGTELPKLGERTNYVADMRNQITGIKSIYQALAGNESKMRISEEVSTSEVEDILFSDMREIYGQIQEKHEEVYESNLT